MMTKDQIKSILKILDKKSFNQTLAKLHYRKEKNIFIATNSYLLLQIKNPFSDIFECDFSIGIDDLKKIKDYILWIKIEWEIATIYTKSDDIKIVINRDESFPDEQVENISKQKTDSKSAFINSKHYAKFFEIANLL